MKQLEDWQKLILEQFDTSYKKPHQCEIRVVQKIIKVVDEEKLKLYYHAGRFVGGAKDKLACKSYEELRNAGKL